MLAIYRGNLLEERGWHCVYMDFGPLFLCFLVVSPREGVSLGGHTSVVGIVSVYFFIDITQTWAKPSEV